LGFVFDHMELVLSVLCALFAIGVSALAPSLVTWEVMGLTSTTILLFHGAFFWLVRRRQRRARREAIEQIKGMLADVVNNKLAVIALSAPAVANGRRGHDAGLRDITTSILAISKQVNQLSEESLVAWQMRYPPEPGRGNS